MTSEKASRAYQTLQAQGETVKYLPTYSGRGMFGKTTMAIVTEIAPEAISQWCQDLTSCRFDNLGKAYVYF